MDSPIDFEDELILIENQFNKLKKDKLVGILDYNEEMRLQNKIVMALTQIIEKI